MVLQRIHRSIKTSGRRGKSPSGFFSIGEWDMTKTIKVGEKDVTFKTSGAIPHIYRRRFGRDLFLDMARLEEGIRQNAETGASYLDIESLEIFENIAFTFALHADPDIPDNIEEWMEQFETFDIYFLLPELLGMWFDENKSTSKLKKKSAKSTGK